MFSWLLECIRTLSIHIKQLDKAIERHLDGTQAIPDIGLVFCSEILAEIGDINCFKIKPLLPNMTDLHGFGDFEAEENKMKPPR